MDEKMRRNNNYRNIALYILGLIAGSTLIIKIIMNWDSTKTLFGTVIDMLYPFILGAFIAYFLNPLSKLLNEKIFSKIAANKGTNVKKLVSIIVAYIIVFGLIITALFYIIPQMIDSLMQITTFFNSAQSGYNELMDKLFELEKRYPDWDLSSVNKSIEEIPEKIIGFISNELPTILPTIYNTSMSFISGIFNALIALIVSIYMLVDKHILLNNSKRITYALFGKSKGDKILNTASECNKIFGNFIIGKLIDSLIIGILCFAAMSILRMPYALTISVIVGVTNMIPYFGPFIGAVPGILLLLIVDLKYAVIFLVLIIVLQQFDGLFLGPKILGDSTGLRPLWIIFAITIGGSIAGVIGMFLGVPTVAVIAYLLNNFIGKKLNERKISFETDEGNGIITRRTEDMKKESVKETAKNESAESVNL